MKDLKNWLIKGFGKKGKVASQTVSNLQEIWKCVDPSMDLSNNKLKDVADVEDFFFIPLFNKLKEQLNLPSEQQVKHIQASTIASKLTSINHLVLFLASRDVYIGQY